MVDLKEIQYCLGLQVYRVRGKQTKYLSQHKYLEGILKCYGMAESMLVETLIDPNSTLSMDMSPNSAGELEMMRHVPY